VGSRWGRAEVMRIVPATNEAGVVMVSSELPEVLGVSDRILVLRQGRVSAEFLRDRATAEEIMHAAV